MNPREIELGLLLARIALSLFSAFGPGEIVRVLRTARFELVGDAPYTVLEMVHPNERHRRMSVIRHKSRAVVVRFKNRLIERLEEKPEELEEVILFAPVYARKVHGMARS
jgi:hypothetical protein